MGGHACILLQDLLDAIQAKALFTQAADHFQPGRVFRTIQAQAAAQGSLRMSFLLRGKQDEFVTNLQRISGTRSQHETAARYTNRPKEPSYRIIQPNGEQVASGSFEYG